MLTNPKSPLPYVPVKTTVTTYMPQRHAASNAGDAQINIAKNTNTITHRSRRSEYETDSNQTNTDRNSAQGRKIRFTIGGSSSSIEEEQVDAKTDNVENIESVNNNDNKTHAAQIPYTYISSYTRPRISKQVNDLNCYNDHTAENRPIPNDANIIPLVGAVYRRSRHQPIGQEASNQFIMAARHPSVRTSASNRNGYSVPQTFFEKVKNNPKKSAAIATGTVLALALLAVGITALAHPVKAKELFSAFDKNTAAFAEATAKAITKVIKNFFSDPQFNKKLAIGAGVTAGVILLAALISWALHQEGRKHQNDQTNGCEIIYESTPGIPGTMLDGVTNLSNKVMNCFQK